MPKPILNEDTLSEKPALRLLEKLGYEFIPGEKLDPQEVEEFRGGPEERSESSVSVSRLLGP